MSEPFVGEIRMFAGNFAPQGWAFCNGQLLAISQNNALFSLLGTIYGGDGRTTFGLPDLRGRVPIHMGTGPGLSSRSIGQLGGAENVTLSDNQMPAHSHPIASSNAATIDGPGGQVLGSTNSAQIYGTVAPNSSLAAAALQNVGGGQAHENRMPFICVNFIIALFGIYPSRS